MKESDSIGVHDVTVDGDPFLLIEDGVGNTFYLDGLQMLYPSPHCLAF